nr:hypothetical protein [Tanacetum cinerariifolium]
TACGSKKKDGAAGKDGKGGPQPIKEYPVLVVRPDSVTLYQDYPATVQGQQNVEIRPKVDGYVEAIYVDEGATVKKGQRLFHISAPQYEQDVRTARAGILTAEADVNTARMGVNKVAPLVARGIISKYELEGAQYTLEAKLAALAQAKATLANALTNLGYTDITSPREGAAQLYAPPPRQHPARQTGPRTRRAPGASRWLGVQVFWPRRNGYWSN